MWYVIHTEAGQEENVKQQIYSMLPQQVSDNRLRCMLLHCIRKKRYLGTWHDKKEQFLPGYLFLVTEKFENSQGIFNKMKFQTPFGCNDIFFPVRQEEIEFLMKLTAGRDRNVLWHNLQWHFKGEEWCAYWNGVQSKTYRSP